LIRVQPFDKPNSEGYKGGLYFDAKTIKVFDPIDADGVRKIWPTFTGFSHVRQKLDRKGYPTFERSLRGVELSAVWLRAEEAGDEALGGEDRYVPNEGDSRPLVERQLRERRGQAPFRNALRQRHGERCLVTGCKVLAVIEAAHIKPFRGQHDHHPENGLLLRSDIHTLFDLNLLGIEPDTLRVELHHDIEKEYGHVAGKALMCEEGCRPSHTALQRRYKLFRNRLSKPA
jgi:hypothetical protein